MNRVEDVKRLKSFYTNRIDFKSGEEELFNIVKDCIGTDFVAQQSIKAGVKDGGDEAKIAYKYNNVKALDSIVKRGTSNCGYLVSSMWEDHPDTIEYLINKYGEERLLDLGRRYDGRSNLAYNGYVDLLKKYDKEGKFNFELANYYCRKDDVEGVKRVGADLIYNIDNCIRDSANVVEYLFDIGVYTDYERIASIAISRGREDLWQKVKWHLIREMVIDGIAERKFFITKCAEYYRFDIIKELIGMDTLLPHSIEEYIELCEVNSYFLKKYLNK